MLETVLPVILDGVASDHQAVRLDITITITSIKFKTRAISRGTIDWSRILNDDHTRMIYNEHLLQLTSNDMDYDSYQEAIL